MTDQSKPARYLHEADPILAAVSRVPSAFVEAVKATIEELKRQIGYADQMWKEGGDGGLGLQKANFFRVLEPQNGSAYSFRLHKSDFLV